MKTSIFLVLFSLFCFNSLLSQQNKLVDSLRIDLESNSISADSLVSKYLTLLNNQSDSIKTTLFYIFDVNIDRFSSSKIIDINNKRFSTLKDIDRVPVWNHSIAALLKKEKIDSTNLAFAINSLGEWYAHIGENDLAIKQFIKTISIFPDSSLEMELGYSYNNLGNLLGRRGDPGSAIPFMEKAIYVFSHHLGNEHNYISIMYNNLGMSYGKLNDLDKQLEYLLKSLEIRHKTVDFCHDHMFEIRNNLAICYKNLGAYSKAEKYINDGLKCSSKDDDKYIKLLAVQLSIRDEHNEKYSDAQSELLYLETIEKAEKRVGKNHPLIRDMYNNAGVFFYGHDDPELAVHYFERAIRSRFDNKEVGKTAEFSLPKLNESKDFTKGNLSIFTNLGSAYYNLYSLTNQAKYLDSSFNCFQLCDQISDALKTNILQGDSRQLLKIETRHSFIMSNRTSFELYKLRNERMYIETIFSNAEKIKSWELLEKYAFSSQAESVNQTETVVKINEIKDKLVFGKTKLLTDSLSLEYNFLLEKLKDEHPTYYQQLYGKNIISLVQLQELCGKQNEQWIIYFQMPYDKFSSFYVNQDTIEVMDRAMNSKATDSIKNEIFVLLDEKSWNFVPLAEQLFDTLIRPFESLLDSENLVFQCHNQLLNLPFEILIDKSKMDISARNDFIYEYLIGDYSISYMHSASLAYTLMNRPRSFKSPLFVAPKYTEKGQKLKWSDIETKEGKEMIGGSILYNTQKENLLEQIKQYDHFHYAGHVVANSKIDSTFLLISEGKDSLFLSEISGIQHNANLVILSACESGIGKTNPDVLISPAYAFTFAGSPNIISSLWMNNDESSAKLFRKFYQNLRDGYSSIAALRKAKIDFINLEPKPERHPVYWAAFTHYGNGAYLQKKNWTPIYIVAGILFLFGIFWFFSKSIKRKRNTV